MHVPIFVHSFAYLLYYGCVDTTGPLLAMPKKLIGTNGIIPSLTMRGGEALRGVFHGKRGDFGEIHKSVGNDRTRCSEASLRSAVLVCNAQVCLSPRKY